MATAPKIKNTEQADVQPPRNPQQELQDFAYVVSHDLTAPARHVKQFTEILCSRLEDKLEEDEKEFITHLTTKLQLDKKTAQTIAQVMVIKNKG